MIVANHYWAIGGSTSDVYQSSSNTRVPVNNADYVAWKVSNGDAVPIASESELAEALRANGSTLPLWLFNASSFIQPSIGAYSKPQLAAYAADARYRRASGGLTVTSISAVPFLTDPVARNTLANANEYAKAVPHTTDWKLSDGNFVPLSPTQIATAANAMANFVQSCFTCESTNATAINGGSVTTLVQIDAAFAAIANVVP